MEKLIIIFLDKRKKVTFSKKVDIQLIPCEEVSFIKSIKNNISAIKKIKIMFLYKKIK